MLLPEESQCIQVSDAVLQDWKARFVAHAEGWYRWAHGVQKMSFDIKELILITGYVRTPKWVILVAEGTGQFTLDVEEDLRATLQLKDAATDESEPLPMTVLQTKDLHAKVRWGSGGLDLSKAVPDDTVLRPEGGPPILANQIVFIQPIDMDNTSSMRSKHRR